VIEAGSLSVGPSRGSGAHHMARPDCASNCDESAYPGEPSEVSAQPMVGGPSRRFEAKLALPRARARTNSQLPRGRPPPSWPDVGTHRAGLGHDKTAQRRTSVSRRAAWGGSSNLRARRLLTSPTCCRGLSGPGALGRWARAPSVDVLPWRRRGPGAWWPSAGSSASPTERGAVESPGDHRAQAPSCPPRIAFTSPSPRAAGDALSRTSTADRASVGEPSEAASTREW
jgi:hypothetical protein